MSVMQQIAPLALDFKTLEQITKLLRLIFISDHPGEVANAVAAARRLLASAGADGHWLADRLTAPSDNPRKRQQSESSVWWCYYRRHLLSPRDRHFIEGVAEQRTPLSTKQEKWLRDVVAKLGEAA